MPDDTFTRLRGLSGVVTGAGRGIGEGCAVTLASHGARVVLAVVAGEAVQAIASRWECDPATVWRFCRRYEQAGLAGLLAPSHRSGRPERISPPAAGSDHPTGLPGAGGQGAAHHPLVE